MRLINNYNNFKVELLNENYTQAKKFLKDMYVFNNILTRISGGEYSTDQSGLRIKDKVTDDIPMKDIPEKMVKLVNNKINELEHDDKKDPAFRDEFNKLKADSAQAERSDFLKKIRDMAGKNLGYTYMYVYFILQEGVPFEEVEQIHNQLVENNDLLNLLRRNISNYIDTNIPNNFEQMIDDMEVIRLHKKLQKFVHQFPAHLKRDFRNAQPYLKEKLVEISNAFDEIGGMEGGKINLEKQKSIQKRFYEKIRRYRNLRDMVVAAENFLKAEANSGFSNFQDAIEVCNRKFGNFGVKVLFDDEQIIVMEVLSFQACRDLFSNTSWCIKDSLSTWNSYVGPDKYNKQYMISNFNLTAADNKSVIGVTIQPGDTKVRNAHQKNDGNVGGNIRQILNDFGRDIKLMEKDYLWNLLHPMSEEEVADKKRRAMANKRVIEPGLSFDQLKTLIVNDGADPNSGSSGNEGSALHNAILDYDKDPDECYKKVEFLFSMGASPNLRNSKDGHGSTITNVKDYEILKLFIKNGAELNAFIIRNLAHNPEAIKFCLDNGLNPNMGGDIPLRLAIKAGNLASVKLLIEYNASVNNDRGEVLHVALESNNMEIVDYFIDELGINKQFDRSINWLSMTKFTDKSGKVWPVEKRFNHLNKMQGWIDSGRVTTSDDGYRVKDANGRSKIINREKAVEMYGSILGWALRNSEEYKPFISKIGEKTEKIVRKGHW